MSNKRDRSETSDMIILGVHLSGLIACDVETRRIPPSILKQYFTSEKAIFDIKSCIEKAKSHPFYVARHKIRVQVSAAIGQAIKSGSIESIYGLKEFLEEIGKETDNITVIGRAASEDEILEISRSL